MSIKGRLKTFAFQHAPDSLLIGMLESHYQKKLMHIDESTEHDLAVVKQLVRRGECVIDVGANFGLYTVFLARSVGEEGQVYSFEPIPLTFKILSRNIKHFELNNVEVYNFGLSNAAGQQSMQIPKSGGGGENFYRANIVRDQATSNRTDLVPVNLMILDSLLSNLRKPISFIKIDVEGHEAEVLMGSSEVIDAFKPALQVEISGSPEAFGSSAHGIFQRLREQGYTAYSFDGVKLKQWAAGDRSVNYFFLADSHTRRCQELMPAVG